MSLNHRLPLIRNAAIAALAGGAVGAAAGFVSIGHARSNASADVKPAARTAIVATASALPPPQAPAAAKPAAAPAAPASAPATPASAPAPAAAPPSVHASAAPAAAPVRQPAVPAADSPDLLQRAQALAQRPDVKTLVALRESFLRHITERGEAESPQNQRTLDTLNRYLADARLLRLKLDAEQFRGGTEGSRPR